MIFQTSSLLIASAFLLLNLAWANPDSDPNRAILTQLQGKARIFSNPTKDLPKSADTKSGVSHVLFEGEYYTAEDAKVGVEIDNGNIVQTFPGAKAKLVYPNGDQFYVSSGTSYRIFFKDTFKEKIALGETRVNLMYGKIRGVIEKGGPRTRLYVKTKTSMMGVRGTDFFIAQGGDDEATEVSILRGSVVVTPIVKPSRLASASDEKVEPPKPIEIKAGYSADIGAQSLLGKVNLPTVELRKTTKEEFAGIQKSSVIPKVIVSEATPPVDAGLQKQIESLEKKAVGVTLNDIQSHDKVLFKKMQALNLTSADDLNNAAMQTLVKEAPKAKPKGERKPFKSELDDLQSGAYEKYFKEI